MDYLRKCEEILIGENTPSLLAGVDGFQHEARVCLFLYKAVPTSLAAEGESCLSGSLKRQGPD
jgi:hypothetical protein